MLVNLKNLDRFRLHHLYGRLDRCLFLILLLGTGAWKLFSLQSENREDIHAAPAVESCKTADMPLAAQYAISAAIGRDNSDYHAVNKDEGWSLSNPANRFRADMQSNGVSVVVGRDDWTMCLECLESGETMVPIAHPRTQMRENRFEYDHGQISVWYVNGPLGLQQGFTLRQRPVTSGSQPDALTVALRLGGSLRAALNSTSDGLSLLRQDGTAVLTYGGLAAYDANGRALRVSLNVDTERGGQTLTIRVDDSRANYPLRRRA